MSLTKRIVLTIIALVGFLTSVKLTMIYWDANFNPYALSSFCSINDLIDCDGVAKAPIFSLGIKVDANKVRQINVKMTSSILPRKKLFLVIFSSLFWK